MRILLIAVAAAMIGGVATYVGLTLSPQGPGVLEEGMVATAIEISAEGSGGFVLPNDRVDVLLTRSGGAAREVVLRSIRVLAIDQNADRNAQKVVLTATLQVSPAQADTLKQAGPLGVLSLALPPIGDAAR